MVRSGHVCHGRQPIYVTERRAFGVDENESLPLGVEITFRSWMGVNLGETLNHVMVGSRRVNLCHVLESNSKGFHTEV